jgi:hypothetical protein
MADRITSDSAVEGDRVRVTWISGDLKELGLYTSDGVVVAARPAGKNFVDVQLDDGPMQHSVCSYTVISKVEPATVVDSELRDQIAAAFDKHEWDGGDHANHPLEDFVAVAVGAVAPALKKAYLDGHDSGYAAANVADPWAEQPMADTELRSRIAEVAREASGTTEGSQYYAPIHWDDVAEEIHAKVVAPVLAARDEQIDKLKRQLEDVTYQLGERRSDCDKVKEAIGPVVYLTQEYANLRAGWMAKEAVQALTDARAELQCERESRQGLIDALRTRALLAEGERDKADRDNESLATPTEPRGGVELDPQTWTPRKDA